MSHFYQVVRTLCCILFLSFPLSVVSKSNDLVQVVFPSYMLGFPDYLKLNNENKLEGLLIEYWSCVLSQLDIVADYQLLPPRRAAHQFITNGDVIYGAKIKTNKKFYSLPDGAKYSNEIFQVYALLVVRRQHSDLLNRDDWWNLKLAGIEASGFNLLVYDKHRELELEARHVDQLMNILLGRRVDAVLFPSLYNVEEYLGSHKLPVEGRIIETASISGVVSGHLLRYRSTLVDEIDSSSKQCSDD